MTIPIIGPDGPAAAETYGSGPLDSELKAKLQATIRRLREEAWATSHCGWRGAYDAETERLCRGEET
jgi:hypothetical protein